MDDRKLIWLGTFVAVGIISTGSVVAQTNQSDTSGGQTYSANTVNIDSQNGNGVPPTTQLNPNTGEVVGGGIKTPVQIDNTGEGEGIAVGCATTSCAEGQPRSVTLNQVAEVLDASLEQSWDNLAAAEQNAELAGAGPRRIARRSAVSDESIACINPVYEAQDAVEKQLMESEKFIEQVDRIEPQKNIW